MLFYMTLGQEREASGNQNTPLPNERPIGLEASDFLHMGAVARFGIAIWNALHFIPNFPI